MSSQGLVIDLFAGGGGASTGIEAALGRPVDIAINHDRVALAAHKANHPNTVHLEADIWDVKPTDATGGRPVALLWASPDCTHFSIAKGNVPRKQKIRSLAWAVARWAAATSPAVIIIENVSEFRSWGPLGKDNRPVKRRMGVTFLRWKGKLEKLGYRVEFTMLDAAEHGAPTRRRRLFIVARRDGKPVCWPVPTHGAGRLPFHTAAECIDWALSCPSIFERKRPLAEKTLWRIAQGIKRFVLENPRPFVIRTDHHKSHATNAFDPEQPIGTITSANGHAVVMPSIVRMAHGEVSPNGVRRRGKGGQAIEDPLPTITGSGGGGGFALMAPSLMKFRHDSAGAPADGPMPTITAGGRPRPGRPATGNPLGLLAPVLAATGGPARSGNPRSAEEPLATVMPQNNEARGASVDDPLSTVTASQRGDGLVAATLIQTGFGERDGQAARVPHLDKPLGTIVAGGQKHAAVAAFLAKHYTERNGCVNGQAVDQPAATITASDHHALVSATIVEPGQRHGRGQRSAEDPLSTVMAKDRHAIAAAALVQFNHNNAPVDPMKPLPTITSNNHVAEVRAFLTTYYGEGSVGQRADAPLRTVTSKDRLGLVTVEGSDYQIVDIGMRMLEPHELLRAQFGRFAAGYDLSAAETKSGKVRLIGNSVCPEVAEAVVRANITGREASAVA